MKKQSKYRWPHGTEDLVVNPDILLNMARHQGVITDQEYEDALDGRNDLLAELAYDQAAFIGTSEDYGGHGFGSSDYYPLIKGLERDYNRLKPKRASVSPSIHDDLIKLGDVNKELRPHIRKVLATLCASDAEHQKYLYNKTRPSAKLVQQMEAAKEMGLTKEDIITLVKVRPEKYTDLAIALGYLKK